MPESQAEFPAPSKPKSEPCEKAYRILCGAHDAASEFLSQFRSVRKHAGPGSIKDTHQDILRAMLVFACAGFDSCLKRLLQDSLQAVIEVDPKAHDNFTEAIKRKLPDIERSRDLLAKVLTAANPRAQLVQQVLDDLLGESLQSIPQFARVLAAFNVQLDQQHRLAKLKAAFDVRNQIIHEMDIDFSKGQRIRRQRSETEMTEFTATVLDSVGQLLHAVDSKLKD